MTNEASRTPLLAVRDLTLDISTPQGVVRILEDVAFDVHPGEIVGVVGESGSGKSMTALSVLRILPPGARIVGGGIEFEGVDLAGLRPGRMRRIRGRRIAMVFQDHMTTLDPVVTIGAQIEEAYLIHHPRASRAEARARMVDTLEQVGVADAAERAAQYPHQWSGGMRQRAVIAMALINDPDLIIADRAHHGPRRHGPGGDPQRPPRAPRRARPLDHADHARHGGHRRHGRPHRRDEGGQGRGDGRGACALLGPAAPLHARTARRRARAGRHGVRAGRARGRSLRRPRGRGPRRAVPPRVATAGLPRGRRRQLHRAHRHGARAGRRIGIREVDDRQGDRGARPGHIRQHPGRERRAQGSPRARGPRRP